MSLLFGPSKPYVETVYTPEDLARFRKRYPVAMPYSAPTPRACEVCGSIYKPREATRTSRFCKVECMRAHARNRRRAPGGAL